MNRARNIVPKTTALEIWGGVECTRNRVQSLWLDQTMKTGHFWRPNDLDRIAELGLKTVRYPVL